jgi:hypothetical protein
MLYIFNQFGGSSLNIFQLYGFYSLLKWSDRWLLKFNKSKCKHIHLGPNTNIKYKMRESNIQQVTEEKDLGPQHTIWCHLQKVLLCFEQHQVGHLYIL